MREAFIKEMAPKMERAARQQRVFRWGVTIAVVITAACGAWDWAWFVLALAFFAAMVDVGLAIVGCLVTLAASQLPRAVDTPVKARHTT